MKIPRKKHKADVPSVAMGDIAFNLLIFFVILAKAQDDSHLNWTPAATQKVESAGPTRVSVLINSENKLHLNGQPIGLSQLAPRVKELLGEAPAGDRAVGSNPLSTSDTHIKSSGRPFCCSVLRTKSR